MPNNRVVLEKPAVSVFIVDFVCILKMDVARLYTTLGPAYQNLDFVSQKINFEFYFLSVHSAGNR
jgi:hypothetical protein